MKLVVLSRSRRIPSTARLCEAAERRGHKIRVVNPAGVALLLGGPRPRVQYRSKLVSVPDVIVPRLSESTASHGMSVVDQFALRGAVTLNSARAIGQARNTARCLQALSSNGIEVPRTVLSQDPAQLKHLAARVGGVPVLVKLIDGRERHGVMVCESPQSLEAALEAVLGFGHHLVMQEYVRKAGRDLRVLVVGGAAVASVSRRPRPGRLSRSLRKNAKLEAVELSAETKGVAEAAARVCGLELCAVDLLETKDGRSKVYEVIASPALPELEEATSRDLATLVITHAETLLERHRRAAQPVGGENK